MKGLFNASSTDVAGQTGPVTMLLMRARRDRHDRGTCCKRYIRTAVQFCRPGPAVCDSREERPQAPAHDAALHIWPLSAPLRGDQTTQRSATWPLSTTHLSSVREVVTGAARSWQPSLASFRGGVDRSRSGTEMA